MFEPVQATHLTDLVQAALLHIARSRVTHPELLQADALPPSLEEPHASIHNS